MGCFSTAEYGMSVMSSIKIDIQERVRFFRSFLSNPRAVGAILPTSKKAVRDMLDMADFGQAHCVAELGAGTGAYTEEVLKRLRPDARLLAFEVDRDLVETLSGRLDDPRLEVIHDSAENIGDYLSEGEKVDVIVSGLPFTSLPEKVKRNMFEQIRRVLAPDGVMVAIQYSTFAQKELERHFGSIRRRVSLVNVPPAFLFACDAALPQEAGERR
jgi:phospholipid N-methyltransferase